METIVIEMEAAEWEAVMRKVVPFVNDDERHATGCVAVSSDGSTRTWWASDGLQLVQLRYPCAGPAHGLIGMGPRVLNAWPTIAGDVGRATLTFTPIDSGGLACTFAGAAGAFETRLNPQSSPSFDEVLAAQLGEDSAHAVLEAESLSAMLHAARRAPNGALDGEQPLEPLFWISIAAGSIVIDLDWEDYGRDRYSVAADVAGESTVAASPRLLSNLVDSLDPGPVKLVLPSEPSRALRLEQEGHTVLLMPVDPGRPARQRATACLEEVFGPDVLLLDDDGDFVLTNYGVPVYARLDGGNRPLLTVFATVLYDVEPTGELLEELNQINVGVSFARAHWSDGLVTVRGELVADTVDPPELIAMFDRVRELADGLGPALSVRFGGKSPQASEEVRWANYTRTTIVAELGPGRWIDLSGPAALGQWPFDGEVYVITACNPHGRKRSAEMDTEAMADLAATLVRAGATAIPATGSSYDGQHRENSLLTWGLDESDVLAIARKYGQEAVFRLDADRLEVIGTLEGRTAGRPRREVANGISPEGWRILEEFRRRGLRADGLIQHWDFGDAVVWEGSHIRDEPVRAAWDELVRSGFVLEGAAALVLTELGEQLIYGELRR